MRLEISRVEKKTLLLLFCPSPLGNMRIGDFEGGKKRLLLVFCPSPWGKMRVVASQVDLLMEDSCCLHHSLLL